MARAAIGWGVRDLAGAAKISPDTVARFERGATLRDRTIRMMRNAFEAHGIEFIPNGVIARTHNPSIDVM
jgi:transcriptional regulator with XRE-family HTH domain